MVASQTFIPLPSFSLLSLCATPASRGPLPWGRLALPCAAPPSFLDIYAVQYASLPGYVFSALPHFCLPCPLVSLPSVAQLPLIPAPAPSPVPSPALGLQTSWVSSPASRDVAGAQPLGSGTSGCCLQVGRGLLRVPLILATPTSPGLSRGRGRWEERETETKDRDTDLSSS